MEIYPQTTPVGGHVRLREIRVIAERKNCFYTNIHILLVLGLIKDAGIKLSLFIYI